MIALQERTLVCSPRGVRATPVEFLLINGVAAGDARAIGWRRNPTAEQQVKQSRRWRTQSNRYGTAHARRTLLAGAEAACVPLGLV